MCGLPQRPKTSPKEDTTQREIGLLMRYAAKHGQYRANTEAAILARRPFNASTLSGLLAPASEGQLPEPWLSDWRERRQYIGYAVYSYATPIAWFDNERREWTIPNIQYSVTTSAHQSLTRHALHSIPVEDKRITTLESLRRAEATFA